MREQRFLGELLVRRGLVAQDRLDPLYAIQKERGVDLTDLLVNQQIVEPVAVARAVAEEAQLPLVETIDPERVPNTIAARLPITFAKNHRVLAYGEDDGFVHVYCADPFDTAPLDDLRLLFGKPVECTVAPAEKIIDAINRVYERDAGGGELETEAGEVSEEEGAGDILDSDDEAPVIRWVNSLFLQAMKERASDIPIEPEEKEVVGRYRIDGELYVARRAPRNFMNAIISRIKIESALNIAEKRLPQDGRITKKIAGKGFDIRVSTIPTSRGYERVVMRLLNKSSVLLDLADLGFSPRDYALMDTLIRRPDGIILVTGPTGSGKTTTLYACINRINQPNLNILTAEDPVEYEIGGIHQVHVQPKIGLTFASALRAFLRQDPDVVMVGEIRDKETAEIAINASLTGHLVLSTIHTNSAAGAIPRMIDMGVEPFLIRSSVIGILAQRLVRVLCPSCKEPYEAQDSELEELGLSQERIAVALAPTQPARHALLPARAHLTAGTCSISTPRYARCSSGRAVARSARTPASPVGAASTSSSSSTTPSGRWSSGAPTRSPSSALPRTWAWTRSVTTARARCSPDSPRSRRFSRRRVRTSSRT